MCNVSTNKAGDGIIISTRPPGDGILIISSEPETAYNIIGAGEKLHEKRMDNLRTQ
jgi:hypothetical protein